jgi:hypothetical protein
MNNTTEAAIGTAMATIVAAEILLLPAKILLTPQIYGTNLIKLPKACGPCRHSIT